MYELNDKCKIVFKLLIKEMCSIGWMNGKIVFSVWNWSKKKCNLR